MYSLVAALDPADFSVHPINITIKKGESASFYLHSQKTLDPKSCNWNMPDYGKQKCSLFIKESEPEEKHLPQTCGSDMNETRYMVVICVF